MLCYRCPWRNHHLDGLPRAQLMIAFIISGNPLFSEVITVALATRKDVDACAVSPEIAIDRIHRIHPEFILMDERLPEPILEGILCTARTLPSTRVLLLSASGNEMVVMDSFRATLHSAEDLMQTLLNKTTEPVLARLAGEPLVEQVNIVWEEAGMYGSLAALFNQSPDTSLVRRLRSIGIADLLAAFADLEPASRQGLQEIASYVAQTHDLTESELATALGVDWTRLFRGIRPGYGPPPPYEALYRKDIKNPLDLLQAIMGCYSKYNLATAPDQANRPDYIGLELGFLSYLAETEAQAWEQDDQASASQLREQSDRFYAEHLSRWASAFCQAALAHCQTGFYRGLIHLTQDVLCSPPKEL